MAFLKQNKWIVIVIFVAALGMALYSGISSMQGRQALPPLTPPQPGQPAPPPPGYNPNSTPTGTLQAGPQGQQGNMPPPPP